MKNNWKEEFDEKFGDFGHLNEKFKGVPMPEEVKDFIESILAEQKKELVEKTDTELRRILTYELPILEQKIRAEQKKELFEQIHKELLKQGSIAINGGQFMYNVENVHRIIKNHD